MKNIYTVLFLLLGIPVIAQNSWVRTTNLPSGDVKAITAIGNNLFAGTTSGVYFSPDDGVTWTKRIGAFAEMRIKSLATDGTSLFAGEDSPPSMVPYARVFRSDDLGLTWTNITTNIAGGANNSMVIYNNDIYLGGEFSGVGIYKSSLSSTSMTGWSVYNNHLSQNNQVKVLALNGFTLMAGLYGDNVWMSPTGTANWIKAGDFPNGKQYVSSLAAVGQYIFAGTTTAYSTAGLYRSTDNGVSWSQVTLPYQGQAINSIIVHNNRIYAGMDYFGMVVSDDYGTSWKTYNDGFLDPSSPTGWACSHMYIKSMFIKGNTIFAGTGCGVWKRTISENYNTISAKAFLDQNYNGIKDPGEPLFTLGALQLIKGTDTLKITSTSGSFTGSVDSGSYQAKFVPYSPYYVVVPAVHNANFSGYFNVDSAIFAVQPMIGKRDMGIALLPLNPARPGFNMHYKLVYANKGTDTADVVVQLVKSNKINYVSASKVPSYVLNDTIRWNIPSLKPGIVGEIDVLLNVKQPPLVNPNDTLISIATISSDKTDLTPVDNNSVLRQRVTGSFDPNDKKENHGGKITKTAIMSGEKLQYTIRFQNTGNDTAFNISVKDTLDNKLDWNSLEMINASHSYQLSVKDGICAWKFDDIKLPDSNRNEPLSHGSISYSIAVKQDAATGGTIQNKAFIYFDYNLPIVTNVENTSIITQLLPVKLLSFTVSKMLSGNVAEWVMAFGTGLGYYEVERSANAKDFKAIGKIVGGYEKNTFTDKDYNKAVNYYRIKMVGMDGKIEYSNIVRVDNAADFTAFVYPNPLNDNSELVIKMETIQPKTVDLDILAPDGKLLFTKKINLSPGTNNYKPGIKLPGGGVYLVRINSPEEKPIILRLVTID
jgi:uncharacterized repeat protein (TIGR01451 family)